jgi:transcription initiation factor TFIIIB Brf1 subunit/transcription initiation factor TFIIB
MRRSLETLWQRNNSAFVSFIKAIEEVNSIGIMSHRRSLRFSKTTCPICGSREVARDDNKGDLLCTNCGHIIIRTETRSVGKFDIAQHLKRNGVMNFPKLQEVTGASDDKLFGVLRSMVEMELLSEIQGQYSLTKKGQRWYRQRLGQEWGY